MKMKMKIVKTMEQKQKSESLAIILQHNGSKYSLTELPPEYVRLNPVEQKILKARCRGLSFSQLDEGQLRVATDQIMLKGSAISGCPTPLTEGFAKTISDELIIFINEYGYDNLTLDEILTAFRLNTEATWRWPSGDMIERVEFSGTCFNVNFVSKIIYIYMALRNSLDAKFKNKISGY